MIFLVDLVWKLRHSLAWTYSRTSCPIVVGVRNFVDLLTIARFLRAIFLQLFWTTLLILGTQQTIRTIGLRVHYRFSFSLRLLRSQSCVGDNHSSLRSDLATGSGLDRWASCKRVIWWHCAESRSSSPSCPWIAFCSWVVSGSHTHDLWMWSFSALPKAVQDVFLL